MTPAQDIQLDRVIDEVLKSRDLRALDVFLQTYINEGTPLKCSQQFLTKLDKLVNMCLRKKGVASASLGFSLLCKCGSNLKLPSDRPALPAMIAQGLLNKWFETCRQLWIQWGPQWNETLLNMAEDFFDALIVVHGSCREGTHGVTESFLYPAGQLAADPRIYILIRKEACRKFNSILDKIPVELKKKRKILTSQEASDIMVKLACLVLDAGDYDFQIALMEALCRMATSDQRKDLAQRWFSMEHVSRAFTQIHDSEFETDCRKFLNLVNGMQGNSRRVYSYPCLEVYLDKHELLMPADDKLEEFWIDFNLGSCSISFYFSVADEGAQEHDWETICITENEVQSYSVTVEGKRNILEVKLCEMVIVGSVEGSSLMIHFSSSLDILQAVSTIYGHSKNKAFVGKTGTSVVKTTVKILMEENSSQIVPESQLSQDGSEKNAAPWLLPAPSASVQGNEMLIPARSRMSESNTYVSSSATGSVSGARLVSAVRPAHTPARGKVKPSLEMVSTEQNKLTAKAIATLAEQEEQFSESSFVPDTQPKAGRNMPSKRSKFSVSEILMMPTQKVNSLPKPESSSGLTQQHTHCSPAQKASAPALNSAGQKKFHAELTQRLQQVLSEREEAPASPADQRPKSRISTVGRCVLTSYTKEQEVQRNGSAQRRSRGLTAVKAHPTPSRSSAKASSSRALQETVRSSVEASSRSALSAKEKGDVEGVGSMMKSITRHYQSSRKETENIHQSLSSCSVSRPTFNMRWVSTTKKSVYGGVSVMKSHSKTAASSSWRGKDVFAFHTDTLLKDQDKSKVFTDSSAINSSDVRGSSRVLGVAEKEPPVEKQQRHMKKHLFSDTDTDCAVTEVSWVRESGRKPKPKVTKYTKKPKAAARQTSNDSPDLSPLCQKPVRESTKPRKKPRVKERVDKKVCVKPPAAAGRSRLKRAAAVTARSYKEQDSDDCLSESEKPRDSKQDSSFDHLEHSENVHNTATSTKNQNQNQAVSRAASSSPGQSRKSEQPPAAKKYVDHQRKNHKSSSVVSEVKTKLTHTYRTLNNNQSEQRKTSEVKQQNPDNGPERLTLSKRSVSLGQEQMSALKGSWASCQTSFSPCPTSVERMRSAERSAPNLAMTCSPPHASCQDTPSPVSAASSPRISKRSSFYSAEKRCSPSRPQPVKGCPPSESRAAEQLSPPASPPASPPLLTSTRLELGKMASAAASPLAEANASVRYGFTKVSSVSLSLSSIKSSEPGSKAPDEPRVDLCREKSPLSNQESERPLLSGPSRKRRLSCSSTFKDDEKEERKSKKRGMKPRKLFKSFNDVSAERESSHTVCSSTHWEAQLLEDEVEMDEDLELPKTDINPGNMCQQLSSELKKKFQGRHKMVELYNNQSLKMVQQHVSSLNTQVTKHRRQQLEDVQKVLFEEIHKLEQSDAVLKTMEKDLTIYWKKQSVAFRSYKEQELRRNQILSNTLSSSVSSSLEFEERLFTSQMCLIRNDMKSVQDKLLSQMQEGEIRSVRRGLHALFFP